MRRLDAGTSGAAAGPAPPSDLRELGEQWVPVLSSLLRGRTLRPVQHAALFEARILDSRQHLVVCAPTNSGKSLIGALVLVDAADRREILLIGGRDGRRRRADPGVEGRRRGRRGEAEAGEERDEGERGLPGLRIEAFDVVGWAPDARDAVGVVAEFVFEAGG